MLHFTTEWDLSDLCEDINQAQDKLAKVKEMGEDLASYRGSLNNKEKVLEFLKKYEEYSVLSLTVDFYGELRKLKNGKDSEALKFHQEYLNIANDLAVKLSFVDSELAQNSDQDLLAWSNNKEFKDFDLWLADIVENKKHIIDPKIEEAISKNKATGAADAIFKALNDVDIDFGEIFVDGKKTKLTLGLIAKLMKSEDQSLRKKVYNRVRNTYGKLNYTFGEIFLADKKETIFYNKLRNFDSVLNQVCRTEKVSEDILHNLLKVVNKNLDKYAKFNEVKKEILGLKVLNAYDTLVSVSNNKNIEIPYTQGATNVINALSVIGDEYVENIKVALTNGWVDAFDTPNKAKMEYCAENYGTHSYIHLLYNDTYRASVDLAHELGHAMNIVYSQRNQPFNKAYPTIFTGEVASTVNEILLFDYMYKNAKSVDEKINYLETLLNEFCAAVYVQCYYEEFEHFVYTQLESGKSLIVEDLNNKYLELKKKYLGASVKISDNAKYEWQLITHFFSPYYVYKYATGFISAYNIAYKIINGDEVYKTKYIKFLAQGGSEKPLDMLKALDVDLTDEAVLQEAFDMFSLRVDELKRLTKEKLC